LNTFYLARSISANPSTVKCFFSFIIETALQKSKKSIALTPYIGYKEKKGVGIVLILRINNKAKCRLELTNVFAKKGF
jgi:hypothetical protein